MSGAPEAETKSEKPVTGPVSNPDALEVAPGTAHEKLEGWIPELASDAEIREALEKAFDYRGDVSITLKNGSKIEGYIFDRRSGQTLADSRVRLFPAGSMCKGMRSPLDATSAASSDRSCRTPSGRGFCSTTPGSACSATSRTLPHSRGCCIRAGTR